MHCDGTDDPTSRHIETPPFEAQRLGLQGRHDIDPSEGA
jgi:hypothetical protein